MQNRYAGDIGDYVKLSILRHLTAGRRLGFAWWLFPDESHNNDGGHREYLSHPEEWKHFDCELFDALSNIDKEKKRNVAALEPLIPDALFAKKLVPCKIRPFLQRPVERKRWLLDMKRLFKDRDLIFLDPDNGIAPEGLRPTHQGAGKSVLISDLEELKENHRAIVVYHHQSRRKGGHVAELRYLAGRLRESGFRVCGALRAKPWSPRAFFVLDGNEELCSRALDISRIWEKRIEWHSDV